MLWMAQAGRHTGICNARQRTKNVVWKMVAMVVSVFLPNWFCFGIVQGSNIHDFWLVLCVQDVCSNRFRSELRSVNRWLISTFEIKMFRNQDLGFTIELELALSFESVKCVVLHFKQIDLVHAFWTVRFLEAAEKACEYWSWLMNT